MTYAPDRIRAYNERQTGYGFTAKGPQPHFQGVEYVRADLVQRMVDEAVEKERAAWHKAVWLYCDGITAKDVEAAAIRKGS